MILMINLNDDYHDLYEKGTMQVPVDETERMRQVLSLGIFYNCTCGMVRTIPCQIWQRQLKQENSI